MRTYVYGTGRLPEIAASIKKHLELRPRGVYWDCIKQCIYVSNRRDKNLNYELVGMYDHRTTEAQLVDDMYEVIHGE